MTRTVAVAICAAWLTACSSSGSGAPSRDAGPEASGGAGGAAGASGTTGDGGPQAGCCYRDDDCGSGVGDLPRCYLAAEDRGIAGACRSRPPGGGCYADSDCLAHQQCLGAVLCCNCLADDVIGTCDPPRGADCAAAPPAGCCLDDADCGAGERCYGAICSADTAGRCLPAPGEGECWESVDCPSNGTCVRQTVCPCGTTCALPDTPGECGFGA